MAIANPAQAVESSKLLFLDDLREHPLPPIEAQKTALDYHQIRISVTGRLNKEPLVDVGEYGIASRSAYARAHAPYYRSFESSLGQVLVRETVAGKLRRVNDLLRPYGAEVLTLDGFRPIDLQHDLWNHFIEQGKTQLENPSEEELTRFAGQFCSDPRGFDKDDFRTWPVHNTGGAIDLTLRSVYDGHELFMGSIFDDADGVSSTRHFETAGLTSQSAIEAKRNRRLLFHAMTAVGFANYAHEWWHFDFGTQMWVMNGGHKCAARYGRTDLSNRGNCAC